MRGFRVRGCFFFANFSFVGDLFATKDVQVASLSLFDFVFGRIVELTVEYVEFRSCCVFVGTLQHSYYIMRVRPSFLLCIR